MIAFTMNYSESTMNDLVCSMNYSASTINIYYKYLVIYYDSFSIYHEYSASILTFLITTNKSLVDNYYIQYKVL